MSQEQQRSPHKGVTGIRRIINALGYSVTGLRTAFKHESAFRQELILAAFLLPLSLVLPATVAGKAILFFSTAWVLVIELLNSAIEAAVDRVSLETHEFAKRAKDLGSAAVFISLANCGVVWLIFIIDWLR